MSNFLRAARGESTARAPIWIMRQAGRYLPEYRALKERYTFWELCRTPELAADVTLQPIERFPLDAAILFSDIMTPFGSMGIEVEFAPGPVIGSPVREPADLGRLRRPDPSEIAPYVEDAIRIIRERSDVPLIGFAGAPLTMATYAVQGGGSKDFAAFRGVLRRHPQMLDELLERITAVTIDYLRRQIEAGAQAIQLFDSWAGLHDEPTYRHFGLRHAERVMSALAGLGVPRIYLAVGSSHLYPAIAELDCEVLSVDWRLPLSSLRETFPGKTLQGNLDPSWLLADTASLKRAATDVLEAGLGGPHIFNLGHGISRLTSPDNVATLVEHVHAFERHDGTAG